MVRQNFFLSAAFLLAALLFATHQPQAIAASPGLSVSKEGNLLLEGKPFRGYGVNYFNAFARNLSDPSDTTYDRGFKILRSHNIPFARFMACGYWPSEMQLYQTNRAEYFSRLDAFVRSAEQNNIALIPSLFWHVSTVPDLVGEPCDQWGNTESRTHQFMRAYTRQVVTRYRNSKAIWAWEFGNEYNLAADLPNASEHLPPIVPSLGTPATRTARDELTHQHFRTALHAFAAEVRRHDEQRLILSGNSFPRPSAWHQINERSWKHDSPEQSAAMLLADNPYPLNSLTVRCYEDNLDRLPAAMETSRKARLPIIVGEFGVPGSGSAEQKNQLTKILHALEQAKVPLAALWVFDYPAQKEWNVSPGHDRWYQLEAIAELNRRLQH